MGCSRELVKWELKATQKHWSTEKLLKNKTNQLGHGRGSDHDYLYIHVRTSIHFPTQ